MWWRRSIGKTLEGMFFNFRPGWRKKRCTLGMTLQEAAVGRNGKKQNKQKNANTQAPPEHSQQRIPRQLCIMNRPARIARQHPTRHYITERGRRGTTRTSYTLCCFTASDLKYHSTLQHKAARNAKHDDTPPSLTPPPRPTQQDYC